MTRNFHSEPFSESTLTKLELFQKYLVEWLPVFLSPKDGFINTVNIFDFFAGPGIDVNEVDGSPLIIYKNIFPYSHFIRKNSISVNLFFNEFDPQKCTELRKNIDSQNKHKRPFSLRITQLDFIEAFEKYYSTMQEPSTANLIILDQQGFRHITDDIFLRIASLGTTDFMFFSSSSHVHRFRKEEVIKKYFQLSDDGQGTIDSNYVHREIRDYYRNLIFENNLRCYLGQFSLKKDANIYGIIFGSRNIRGLDKFVQSCWKIDPLCGEANFDIDRDHIDPSKPSLFPEMNKPTKIKEFELHLERCILSGEITINHEIYLFSILNGILPKYARYKLSQMKRDNLIPKQKINISYEAFKSHPTILKLN